MIISFSKLIKGKKVQLWTKVLTHIFREYYFPNLQRFPSHMRHQLMNIKIRIKNVQYIRRTFRGNQNLILVYKNNKGTTL